jgi:hypothetical protein
LLIASKELRAQNRDRGPQFQVTAGKLAQAFQSIQLQESLLLQRLRTREAQALRERTPCPDEGQDPVLDSARNATSPEFSEPLQVFERF